MEEKEFFYFSIHKDMHTIVTKGNSYYPFYKSNMPMELNEHDPVLIDCSEKLNVGIDELINLLCIFYKLFPNQPERLSEKTSKEDATV